MNIIRLNRWTDPVFDRLLAARADMNSRVVDADHSVPDDALLADLHIYHISAARDEVPSAWLAGPALVSRAPKLLCVSTSGAGYDTVDVPACTQAGIAVVNQAGGNAPSVAEHALGLMLSVMRRLNESDRAARRGITCSREDLMGHQLSGKTVGLVGLGHIGTLVATMLRGLSCTVLAHDPYLSDDTIVARGATPVSLDDLLARSDVVSLHCPRSPETVNLFNAHAYQAMKPGAVFVSTARGGIHDEDALYDALRSGHLSGAGLDVWSVEPPAASHPLLGLEQVVATYHTAGVSHEARHAVARMAAEQIIGLADGILPARCVNPDVLPVFTERLRAAGIPVRATPAS